MKDVGYVDDKNSSDIEKAHDFLLNEGIIKIFDPIDLLKENDILLTTSISNDMHDDEFVEASIHHSVDVWNILRDRLPPSFLKVFYPGAGTFSEAITLQAQISTSGDLDQLTPNLRKLAEFRWKKSL